MAIFTHINTASRSRQRAARHLADMKKHSKEAKFRGMEAELPPKYPDSVYEETIPELDTPQGYVKTYYDQLSPEQQQQYLSRTEYYRDRIAKDPEYTYGPASAIDEINKDYFGDDYATRKRELTLTSPYQLRRCLEPPLMAYHTGYMQKPFNDLAPEQQDQYLKEVKKQLSDIFQFNHMDKPTFWASDWKIKEINEKYFGEDYHTRYSEKDLTSPEMFKELVNTPQGDITPLFEQLSEEQQSEYLRQAKTIRRDQAYNTYVNYTYGATYRFDKLHQQIFGEDYKEKLAEIERKSQIQPPQQGRPLPDISNITGFKDVQAEL